MHTDRKDKHVVILGAGFGGVGALKRLRDADRAIPAGRVRQDQAQVLADRAAAGSLG